MAMATTGTVRTSDTRRRRRSGPDSSTAADGTGDATLAV